MMYYWWGGPIGERARAKAWKIDTNAVEKNGLKFFNQFVMTTPWHLFPELFIDHKHQLTCVIALFPLFNMLSCRSCEAHNVNLFHLCWLQAVHDLQFIYFFDFTSLFPLSPVVRPQGSLHIILWGFQMTFFDFTQSIECELGYIINWRSKDWCWRTRSASSECR